MPSYSPLISPLSLEEKMNLGTELNESSSGKKKMNMPKEFSGNRDDFKQWMMSCQMYIAGNHKVYPTDFDKINFVLSFMNSGKAATWNEQFIEEQPNLENIDC